jgi:Spy/CpxP family protein refolding chaperone
MKLSTKILATLALSSSLILTSAMAADRTEGRHMKHGFNIERMVKKLSLTQAQSTKIQALVDERKAQRPTVDRDAMKAEMKVKKEDRKAKFVAMMNAPEFDEVAVREKMAERSQKHTDRQVSKMQLRHAIYQVLDEEQREDYLKMMNKKHHKMKKNMKKHRHEYKHDKSHD